MVEKGKNIDLGSISKKLLLQVGYAVVLRIVVPLIYYTITSPQDNTIINMGTINEFNSIYWFPSYYLLIMIVAGFFLNGKLETISQQYYKNILWVMFGVFSLCWSGGLLNSLAEGFRTFAGGLFLYALGGYIKRYNPFKRVKTWSLLLTIMLSYLFIYLSYYGIVQNGIHSYFADTTAMKANGDTAVDFIQPMYYVDNYSLLVIIIGTVLLELFSRMHIATNRIINLIGKGTLMVYLLHGHGFWITLVQEYDWIKTLSQSKILFCFSILKWTGYTYLIGIIGYLLYLALGRLFFRYKGLVLDN